MKEEKLIILKKDYNIEDLDTLVDEAISNGYGELQDNTRSLTFLVTKEQCDKAQALLEAKIEKYKPNITEENAVKLEEEYKGNFTKFKAYNGVKLTFLLVETINI